MTDWPYWDVLTVESFCNLNLPSPKWIVESLIPGDGWTYVIGFPKHGKSILMAQVGNAIQQGIPILDCPSPVEGTVVYIQTDAPPTIWQTQLQAFLSTSRMKTMRTPKGILSLPGGVEKCRVTLETHAPRFVIWDALEHLTGPLKINEETHAKEIVKRLKDATPCAFALIHHPRKSQEVEDAAQAAAGHHYLAGDASAILRVTKTGDATGKLEVIGRTMESRTLRLNRGQGGQWVYLPTKSPVDVVSEFANRIPD